MITTSIYGLYDPREPYWSMYVGKGDQERAQFHWNNFLRHGTAVNALLRNWFIGLKNEGIVPETFYLEERVSERDWPDREKYWIALWRRCNPNLCNIADGGNSPSLESSRIGGIVNAGRGLKRAWELYPELMRENQRIAASKGGKIGGKATHQKHPDMARENGLRSGGKFGGWASVHKKHPDLAHRAGVLGNKRMRELHPEMDMSELGRRAGRIGGNRLKELYPDMALGLCHRRWHVKRNKSNLNCKLCQQEKANAS